MRSYRANYILHKSLPFAFGTFTLLFVIVGLIVPDVLTTTGNRDVVETSILILLPGLVTGLLMLRLGSWLNKNYFRVYMDQEVIDVFKHGEKIRIYWEDIEHITTIEWLWKGSIFKLKPKGQEAFYFLSDKPRVGSDEFDSGMSLLVDKKKRELDI